MHAPLPCFRMNQIEGAMIPSTHYSTDLPMKHQFKNDGSRNVMTTELEVPEWNRTPCLMRKSCNKVDCIKAEDCQSLWQLKSRYVQHIFERSRHASAASLSYLLSAPECVWHLLPFLGCRFHYFQCKANVHHQQSQSGGFPLPEPCYEQIRGPADRSMAEPLYIVW